MGNLDTLASTADISYQHTMGFWHF